MDTKKNIGREREKKKNYNYINYNIPFWINSIAPFFLSFFLSLLFFFLFSSP